MVLNGIAATPGLIPRLCLRTESAILNQVQRRGRKALVIMGNATPSPGQPIPPRGGGPSFPLDHDVVG